MMWVFLAAPLLVAFFGAVLLVGGVSHVSRGRAFKGGRGMVGGTALTAVGLSLSLLGLSIQSFSRLTYEAPVAEIWVHAVDPAEQRYVVTVHRLDESERDQSCAIQGDQWLISGRVQKWKPWANALGLDATYTLDQISNMYDSAERANGRPITACNISGAHVPVNQFAPSWWLTWLASKAYTEDRHFGSANYMPLADGAVYRVVITQMGFNSEPANDIARAANNAVR
jgi:hypothetical protein